MKKFVAVLLVLLLVPCAGFAFAAEPDANEDTDELVTMETEDFYEMAAKQMREYYEDLGYAEVDRPSTLAQVCNEVGVSSELQSLASMDIDNAPAELQEDILAARREIIFSSDGWYADKAGIYLVWFDDEKKEWGELPKFSELFPGWDLPTIEPVDAVDEDVTLSPAELRTAEILFSGRVPLRAPSTTSLTAPFRTWDVPRAIYSFEETITALQTSTSANLGLTDLSVTPNVSLGYKRYLYLGGGLRGFVNGPNCPKVGFRASTYSNPGYATVKIQIERQ